MAEAALMGLTGLIALGAMGVALEVLWISRDLCRRMDAMERELRALDAGSEAERAAQK